MPRWSVAFVTSGSNPTVPRDQPVLSTLCDFYAGSSPIVLFVFFLSCARRFSSGYGFYEHLVPLATECIPPATLILSVNVA
jgi:hypothetical protein